MYLIFYFNNIISKIIMIILLIILAFIPSACNDEPICHDIIYLRNESNIDIVYQKQWFANINDTILVKEHSSWGNDTLVWKKSYLIKPNNQKTGIDYFGKTCFEYSLKFDDKPYLKVFFLDWNIVKTIPWDTIVKKNLVLKRIDVDLKMLQDNNWTLIYP
jgi:hypothetical protein